MKKYDKVKTIQLFIFLAVTITGLYIIFSNENLYRMIAENKYVGLFFVVLWVLILLSFVFMIMDFRAIHYLKLNVNELDRLVFSDPVSGIANRYSCDAIIEKYLDKPLPPEVGCVTFAITNLKDINSTYSHSAGNIAIKAFSAILANESKGNCFVGRNGGDKFLAIFTDCSHEKITAYIERVEKNTSGYNSKAAMGKIKFEYGVAFNEGDSISDISSLISLSNRRAIEKYRTFVER